MIAGLQGREGPGDHARARERPGLARHDDAAPHPVAEMVARPAPDDQRRAVKAGLGGVDRAAGMVARIALDRDEAAGRAGAREGTGRALDREGSARHALAEALADIARDPDRAFRERRPDLVEALGAALDHEAVGAVELYREAIPEAQAPARGADREPGNLGLRETRERERRDVEEIEALGGRLAQGEDAHAAPGFVRRSRRW
ncbi:hypothetical protein AEGHOMDF_5201 [Methylobacterium soli]|nr:hypothetical protein AEGHOMDF_5201 [Methylobacterium soli]